MPVILAPGDYARWLGDEPDPRELMRPFRADLMRMWPISMRVNKPENVDPAGTDIGLKLRGFAELSCMARLLSLPALKSSCVALKAQV
jgi:hypothetical protein